jgi:peptidoglycan/LPS O-acetylase OafA/YrhL
VPPRAAASATWVGLGAIVGAALLFDARTAYPGVAAALPVAGAALVVAGGERWRRAGASVVLATPPMRAIGRISYSLYLWHWPVLVIAAQYRGKALSWQMNLAWLVLALGLSAASYLAVEAPVRHSKALARRPGVSVLAGLVLTSCVFVVLAVESATHP